MLEDVEKLTKILQTTKIPRAKILAKFEEINKMRSEIQKMDQTTIAEVGFIKSPTNSLDPLKRPNPGIHGQLGLGSTGPRFSFSGPGPVQSYTLNFSKFSGPGPSRNVRPGMVHRFLVLTLA